MCVLVPFALIAEPSIAAEPTMPASALVAGMQCTAKTVIRGTDITTFNVEIVDVVGSGVDGRILGRASGPAVDSTGVAQGFSGSPVYCPVAGGGTAIAGAISEATGDYGNLLILITPIDTMLAEPRTDSTTASASSLSTPLMVSGINGPLATKLQAIAKKAGANLVFTAGAPRRALDAGGPTLEPGASVAASFSTGAVAVGAVGTVTYVDGNRVWAFGHPYEGVGPRSLFMQSAWVHAVVGNPLTLEGATPYKLASTLGTIGSITDDRPSAVIGQIGTEPRATTLNVGVRNRKTNALTAQTTLVADEAPLRGSTSGALQLVAPMAVMKAVVDALHGSPNQLSARMCTRVWIQGQKKPITICNRYVGASATSPGGAMPNDVMTALSQVAGYKFAPLIVRRVDVQIHLSESVGYANIRRVRVVPSNPRRGQRVTVRVESVLAGTSTKVVRTHRIRIPRSAQAGPTLLKVRGTSPDVESSNALEETLNVLFGGDSGGDTEEPQPPRTVAELREEVRKGQRDDRARISLGSNRWLVPLRNNADLRLSGSAEAFLTIRR